MAFTIVKLLFTIGMLCTCTTSLAQNFGRVPMIINTWAFGSACRAGWQVLSQNGSALDAVVAAASECEREQCEHTVGWGGSPDESGETTLDAMIMDGPTHRVGAVAALRNVKNAIGVARAVFDHTDHSMLVGDQATHFAVQMGFKKENLTSAWSLNNQKEWQKKKCQPNYWLNVSPDPSSSCGPYKPTKFNLIESKVVHSVDESNHDTIGIIAIDQRGHVACGTSTNGLSHKIPGRVGDSPIAGAGSYLDQDVGGAAATGDGDIIMRFLCSYQAVENMRNAMSPKKAAEESLKRVLKYFPKAEVALVATDNKGNYGAACIGVDGGFHFSVTSASENTTIKKVPCINKK